MPTQDNSFYIGLIATLVGSFFWLMFVRKRDKHDPEPMHALVYVIIVGGAASTLLALIGNHYLDSVSALKFSQVLANTANLALEDVLSLFMPSALIEELCKYTVAFFIIRDCKHVNEPVDGIIYAITVGLGFSLFENLLYAQQFGGGIVLPRLLFAVPLHMATAAIWGIYFAKALIQNRPFRYFSAFPLMLLAVVLHGFWNASSVFLGGLFYLLAPLVLLYCLKKIDHFIENAHLHSPFNPN